MSLQFSYPLTLRFKLLAISNQFELLDAQGNVLAFVKQPWSKIRELVTVYADTSMDKALFTIKSDRILDLGATYTIANASGTVLGSLKRHMLKSWIKASYSLEARAASGTGTMTYAIAETNPWIKVLDGLISEVPVIGAVAGYILHPRYAVSDAQGVERLEIRKRASLIERKFEITALDGLDAETEQTLVLAALMMILLESKRG